MNDVWRARPRSPSISKWASLVKICRSGQNRMWVPDFALGDPAALAGQPRLRGEAGVRSVGVEDARGAAAEADALLGRRPVDVDVHPRRQRVDDREADAVQAARGDVGAAAELAAGVQLGRHHLDAGEPGLRLLVGRDAPAVVVHLGRAVGVQRHLDRVRRARQRLVDAVVDDLPQALHEPARVGRADVHARPLAHRLETLEDEEVGGVVGVVGDRRAPAVVRPRVVSPKPTRDVRRRRAATPVQTGSRHAERRTRRLRSAQTRRGYRGRHHERRTIGDESVIRLTDPVAEGQTRSRGEHPSAEGVPTNEIQQDERSPRVGVSVLGTYR